MCGNLLQQQEGTNTDYVWEDAVQTIAPEGGAPARLWENWKNQEARGHTLRPTGLSCHLWGHTCVAVCTALGHTACWFHGTISCYQEQELCPQLLVLLQGQQLSGKGGEKPAEVRVLPGAARSLPLKRGEGRGGSGLIAGKGRTVMKLAGLGVRGAGRHCYPEKSPRHYSLLRPPRCTFPPLHPS